MSRDHDDEFDDLPLPSAQSLSGCTIASYNLLHTNPTHVIIPLDGTSLSQLNWDNSLQKAAKCIESGYKIVFHLDLGLFDQLHHPISHEGQFQALKLSCRHFREVVIEKFGNAILGVILYQGAFPLICPKTHNNEQSLTLFHEWLQKRGITQNLPNTLVDAMTSPEMRWNYTYFCHEECIEYLRLLSFELPDILHRFILIEAPSDLSSNLLYSAKDLLDSLHPVIQANAPHTTLFATSGSIWNSGLGIEEESAYFYDTIQIDHKFISKDSLSTALLIPSYHVLSYKNILPLLNAIQYFSENESACSMKIVHESLFTTEWEGIDRVIISKKTLSVEGIRAIHGFIAAGGEVIDIDVSKQFST